MAERFRAAVIGSTGRGDYGHGLDAAFATHPKLELIAVADPDPRGRADAAKRLGAANAYEDYRVMLAKERPQFVAVAPRWVDGHKDMLLACAEHGVRGVFCEKPLGPDPASCDAIVNACDRSHAKVAMAFQTRYSPRWDRIKALIADGAIGEVLEVRGRGKEDRRGGGEDLMVLGVHIFDLCRDLLGEPSWCLSRVSEGGRPVGVGDVRPGPEGIGPIAGDRVDAMFGFAGKSAVAHFATARPKEPGKRFGLTIFGSTGSIWTGTGWMTPAFLLRDPTWTGVAGTRWEPIEVKEPNESGGLAAGNRAIVDDLIHAVETDGRPRADVLAGRGAVEMVAACYASHVRGGLVEMPLKDRSAHPLAGRQA